MMRSTSSGSDGPSNGWMVRRKLSRTISDGDRSTQGISVRAPRQNLENRHRKRRQPGHAGFDQHDLQLGVFGEHAFGDQARHLPLKALRLAGVVLDIAGRPAERRHRIAVVRARMDADRQAVPLGRREDRPVMPPPERHLLHRQHHDLHEALVLGAALDLVDRVFDVLHRHDDRGAQARIAVEPFLGDPVVQRAMEGARHVLVVDELHAVEAVQDREARAPFVEHLRGKLLDARRRVAVLAAKVRPRGDRRVRRIGRGSSEPMPRSSTESRQYSSRCGSSCLMSVTLGCTSQSMAVDLSHAITRPSGSRPWRSRPISRFRSRTTHRAPSASSPTH